MCRCDLAMHFKGNKVRDRGGQRNVSFLGVVWNSVFLRITIYLGDVCVWVPVVKKSRGDIFSQFVSPSILQLLSHCNKKERSGPDFEGPAFSGTFPVWLCSSSPLSPALEARLDYSEVRFNKKSFTSAPDMIPALLCLLCSLSLFLATIHLSPSSSKSRAERVALRNHHWLPPSSPSLILSSGVPKWNPADLKEPECPVHAVVHENFVM